MVSTSMPIGLDFKSQVRKSYRKEKNQKLYSCTGKSSVKRDGFVKRDKSVERDSFVKRDYSPFIFSIILLFRHSKFQSFLFIRLLSYQTSILSDFYLIRLLSYQTSILSDLNPFSIKTFRNKITVSGSQGIQFTGSFP